MSGRKPNRFEVVIEVKSLGLKLEDPGPIESAAICAARELAKEPGVECVKVVTGGGNVVRVVAPDVRQMLRDRGDVHLLDVFDRGDARVRGEIERLLAGSVG